MEALFLKLLNMSITASWIVLAVVILRLLLKKAPKALVCVLWMLVAIRLILPFSIESVFSLIPSAETIPQDFIHSEIPEIDSGIPIIDEVVNPIISDNFTPVTLENESETITVAYIASVIWLIGVVLMLIYTAISYFRVYTKVKEAALIKEHIYICDNISTPFILGVFRPKIYVPSALSEQDMEFVIVHEKSHLKRLDHLIKPFGFLLLSVYWFNPVLWLAYVLLCRDIELACDEKVIKELGIENKKHYSEALLNCSVPRKMIAACPLAFGEVGVKNRIKTILNYKRPAFWIIIIAVLICIVATVCFLTNPQIFNDVEEGEEDDPKIEQDINNELVYYEKEHVLLYCDVNHDGEKESVNIISLGEPEEYGGYKITIKEDDGTEIFSEMYAREHPSWDSLYLCNIDDKDYLLSYRPDIRMGEYVFTYELFYIEPSGLPVSSKTIIFDTYGEKLFSVDEMLNFADELNGYLKNSTLIISSLWGDIKLGPLSGSLFLEDYKILFEDGELRFSDDATLKEKLEAFEKSFEKVIDKTTSGNDFINVNKVKFEDFIKFMSSPSNDSLRKITYETKSYTDPNDRHIRGSQLFLVDDALELVKDFEVVEKRYLYPLGIKKDINSIQFIDCSYMPMIALVSAGDSYAYLVYDINYDTDDYEFSSYTVSSFCSKYGLKYGRLKMFGKQVKVDNAIKVYGDGYADIPLTIILKEIGAQIEWNNDYEATIIYDGTEYHLNTKEKQLLFEDRNVFPLVVGGYMHVEAVKNDIILDQIHIKGFLEAFGIKTYVHVDETAGIVEFVRR